MRKPKEGEIARITESALIEAVGADRVKVLKVFDDLDQDWGPWGELAWSQMDADSAAGQVGEWYIVATEVDANGMVAHEGETWALASYECNTDLMQVVKFRWKNAHGAWIGPDWILALSQSGRDELRRSAIIGRPSMADFQVLDSAPLPEELRQTGKASLFMSQVQLYERRDVEDGSAINMITRMKEYAGL